MNKLMNVYMYECEWYYSIEFVMLKKKNRKKNEKNVHLNTQKNLEKRLHTHTHTYSNVEMIEKERKIERDRRSESKRNQLESI